MMNKTRTPLIASLALLGALATQPAFAQGSVAHSARALDHSGQAIGHLAVGTVKATASVVAVPLAASGAVGQASGRAAAGLSELANAPIGEPLPIADETLTAGPSPAQALHNREVNQ